jgi:hypothetical protein
MFSNTSIQIVIAAYNNTTAISLFEKTITVIMNALRWQARLGSGYSTPPRPTCPRPPPGMPYSNAYRPLHIPLAAYTFNMSPALITFAHAKTADYSGNDGHTLHKQYALQASHFDRGHADYMGLLRKVPILSGKLVRNGNNVQKPWHSVIPNFSCELFAGREKTKRKTGSVHGV